MTHSLSLHENLDMQNHVITFTIRPDLAARLPQDEAELRELLNRAVEHELDGTIKAAAGILGSIKTEKKAKSSVENGKKSTGPKNPKGGRPKGSKNKQKSSTEKEIKK